MERESGRDKLEDFCFNLYRNAVIYATESEQLSMNRDYYITLYQLQQMIGHLKEGEKKGRTKRP